MHHQVGHVWVTRAGRLDALCIRFLRCYSRTGKELQPGLFRNSFAQTVFEFDGFDICIFLPLGHLNTVLPQACWYGTVGRLELGRSIILIAFVRSMHLQQIKGRCAIQVLAKACTVIIANREFAFPRIVTGDNPNWTLVTFASLSPSSPRLSSHLICLGWT